MFWSRSTHSLASRDVTLSFSLMRDFPAGCLLCLVKEIIYTPPQSKDQFEYVNITEAYYWVLHVRGDQVYICQHKMPSFWLALTFSSHSFKSLIQAPSIKWHDACKEWDYLLEGGSRRRIWGIPAIWRLDVSRCLFCPVRKPNHLNRISWPVLPAIPLDSVLQLLNLCEHINVPLNFILFCHCHSLGKRGKKITWLKLATSFDRWCQTTTTTASIENLSNPKPKSVSEQTLDKQTERVQDEDMVMNTGQGKSCWMRDKQWSCLLSKVNKGLLRCLLTFPSNCVQFYRTGIWPRTLPPKPLGFWF